MFEGDDDDFKRLLKKAEQNRALDPHGADQLKRQYERKQAKDRAKLRREVSFKTVKEDMKKTKQETNKKGIVTADQKETTEQKIDNEKRQADIDKAQGQTEKPTQTV